LKLCIAYFGWMRAEWAMASQSVSSRNLSAMNLQMVAMLRSAVCSVARSTEAGASDDSSIA
jgi:hypothetical protein